MTPNIRIYASEAGAQAAYQELVKAGFTNCDLIVPSSFVARSGLQAENENETNAEEAVASIEPHSTREIDADTNAKFKSAIYAAIRRGTLSERYELICLKSLKDGQSIVAVRAPFGTGEEAISLMENGDTVHSDRLEGYVSGNPAPFSRAFGLPLLSQYNSATNLARSDWSFSSVFGLGLLSKNPAPLSSMFGLSTLSRSKRDWRSSFGLPLLSKNGSPLSSLFGLRILSRSQRGKAHLTRNPAPFSSLLGMKTLKDEHQDRD